MTEEEVRDLISGLDGVLPHPQYAAQGWVAIVNPGPATATRIGELARMAHARAAARYR